MKNAFVIAAAASGSGKTTLSLGLMRFLTDKGLKVMPFKCGPDYIDTQYHSLAADMPSINLDLFMGSEEHLKSLFYSYSANNDVSIIEGVMGMFDGFNGMKGSTADIAVKLGLPVILLINAESTAYSVAATIYGFSRFNKSVKVAGVIFNKVSGESHYNFLKKASMEVGIPSLGYLGKNNNLHVPSRHLGLSLESDTIIRDFIGNAAGEVAKHIDVEKLLDLTPVNPVEIEKHFNLLSLSLNKPPYQKPHPIDEQKIKVAVASDAAFNFMYPANLNALNAELIFFSPLKDSELPQADLIYFPGGYPELFATQLEQNIKMRAAVKNFAEKGGKILAECGGMIYLSKEIDGKEMCGVLPLTTTMEEAKLKLGYRKIKFPSLELHGHEFHYSSTKPSGEIQTIGQQLNAKDIEVKTPIYKWKNVIASYTHLYWAEKNIFKLWE